MSKKICVYAICKNEMKFIDQWLENVSEADYICVLDTGSTDGTFEKLQADPRVTRVEQKIIDPWRFDVARNESMKLIPEDADILVCTDFDELFEKGWSDFLRENWTDKTNRCFYTYAWSHNSIGEPTDVFTYDKIHTRDYHWIYPVHEVLEINEGCIQKPIDAGNKIYLHHWQDTSKPRGSYFDLLELSCEEHPNDAHVHMLLAREYLLKRDFENALEVYLHVLKMPDVEKPTNRLILLESLGRCADIYKVLKNYDEAIWYAQEFIKEDQTYREPYIILAEIYIDMKMYTLAEAMLNTAKEYSTRKNTWVERAGSWISDIEDNLSIAEFNLGKIDQAIEHCSFALKHNPNEIRLCKNLNIFLEAKINKLENPNNC